MGSKKDIPDKFIAINLHADCFNGEGSIKIKDNFQKLNTLLKCDLLQDWKVEITNLYNEALQVWGEELKKKELDSFVSDAQEMIKDVKKEGK